MDKRLEKLEFTNIRERFFETHERKNDKGWEIIHVKIFDKEFSIIESIYEYDRNYSMLETFDPFRWWDETKEEWRHFALISPSYTSFEVLDLDNREIIAEKPKSRLTKEKAEELNKIEQENKHKEGDVYSFNSFCTRAFHVPDIYDVLSVSDIEEFKDFIETGDDEKDERDNVFWSEWMNNFLNRRNFAFSSGCIWGDDWSWKIRAIDLTNVLEGEVSEDERFGYFIFNGDLKNVYEKEYFDDDEYVSLVLNTPVSFVMKDNTVEKSYIYSDIEKLQDWKKPTNE